MSATIRRKVILDEKSAKPETPIPKLTTLVDNDIPLPPLSKGASPRAEYYEFSQVLLKAMLKKKLSQSDLARAMWGTIKDNRGYEVARNRDRITHYLKGRAYPEPKNLEKLAEVLEVPIETLQVDKPTKGVARLNANQSDVQIHFLATEPYKALLVVQTLISTSLALEIAGLIDKEKRSKAADDPA